MTSGGAVLAPPEPTERFWLKLPPRWVPLERHEERITEQARRLVADRIPVGEADPRQRRQLEAELAAALRAARAPEVAFAALLAEATTDGMPVVGALTVSTHPHPPGGLAEAARGGRGGRDDVRAVELPFAGTAVRVAYRERVRPPVTPPARRGGPPAPVPAPVTVAVTQYLLPHPEGRRIVALTGLTPTLPLAGALGVLFDALACTFRFTESD